MAPAKRAGRDAPRVGAARVRHGEELRRHHPQVVHRLVLDARAEVDERRHQAVVAAASSAEASMPNSGMISVAKSSSIGRPSSGGIIPQWKSQTK